MTPPTAALPLKDWLKEREANCLRIAKTKTGADKAGWLEDASYFSQCIEQLPCAPAVQATADEVATEICAFFDDPGYVTHTSVKEIIRKAVSPKAAEETLEHVHIFTDKLALVTGDPADLPDSVPDDDPRRHNCDQMGCPSLDHVLYRLPFTDHRQPIDVKVLARQLAESIDFTAGPVQAREAFEKRLDAMAIPASPPAAKGQKAVDGENLYSAFIHAFAYIAKRGHQVGCTADHEPYERCICGWDDIISNCALWKRQFASPIPASGWVMVPREPTKEMLDSAETCRLYTEEDGSDWRNSYATWRDMLAAVAVGETK